VVFHGAAGFSEAAFFSYATFADAIFRAKAHFNKGAFSGNAKFSCAEFLGKPDFTACEFKSYTWFAGTKFLSHAPDFRDAKLREAMEWHDARWPGLPKDKEAAQQQVYAFERLKAEMERLKKHEDEQFFFAKELRARRASLWFKWRDRNRELGKRANSAFGWLMNWAYATFSGYGLSIGRPLFWLITLFVSADIFATTASLDNGPMTLRQAAEFSFTNLFPFLPNKAGDDIIKHLAIWTKYIGDLQSFLGVILLFLLGLALRNRFRMK